MPLDSITIKNQVLSLRQDTRSGLFTLEELKTKHNFLYTNVEHLFDLVVDDKINYMPVLNTLLKQLAMVKDKETLEERDKTVGALLAEKYLYPVLDPELLEKEGIDFTPGF